MMNHVRNYQLSLSDTKFNDDDAVPLRTSTKPHNASDCRASESDREKERVRERACALTKSEKFTCAFVPSFMWSCLRAIAYKSRAAFLWWLPHLHRASLAVVVVEEV